MVSLEMGRKKLTHSCETLSDWIGRVLYNIGSLSRRLPQG